jgi:hypothetical protein
MMDKATKVIVTKLGVLLGEKNVVLDVLKYLGETFPAKVFT